MSFNMILPDIYNFLSSLGGKEYKGYVLFLFTLTAAISRPFSGKLSDKVGRKPVIIFGAFMGAIGCMSYAFILNLHSLISYISPVLMFFIIRIIHGLSTGFKPTGTAAMLADIIPEEKRGEALGWFGFAGSLGMGIGPSLGASVQLYFGYHILFVLASFTALLSAISVLNLPETLPKKNRKKLNFNLLKITPKDFFEPRVVLPTTIFFLYAFSFGTIFTIMPDRQESMGIENKGFFFTIYILITALTRIVGGKISDRLGRRLIIMVGITLLILALVVLAWADTINVLIIGAALYGIAHGATAPAIFAWVADLANPQHKGRAYATMFIGMEMGIGIGAWVTGMMYANNSYQFKNILLLAAFMAAIGLFILIIRKK